MRTFDLTPLFRSSVGFDRLSQMVDAAMRLDDSSASFPPYNIEKRGDNDYRITMAVAGYAPEDVTITTQDNNLIIHGEKKNVAGETDEEATFLHRGIANRTFERRFQIAEHIRIQNASMENGLLHIEMVREIPDYLKPRTIEISTPTDAMLREPKTIDTKAA